MSGPATLDVAQLYAEIGDTVVAFFAARVGADRCVAEDLASATFERVVRGATGFQGNGARPYGWVWTIARNVLIDWQRRQRLVAFVDLREWADGAWFDAGSDRQVDALAVRDAMTQLRPRQRQALVALAIEGRSTDEIAGALGISRGTVKSLAHRARASLRRELTGGGAS